MARLLETTCHADPLVRRFRYALATLLVRPLLHKELEAISCEARRWRLGVLVHDRIINPKTGSVYQPRCYRRGDKRPTRAQPPPRCHMAGRGPVDGEGTRHDGVARVGRFCASSLARRRAKRGAGKSDSFRSVGLGPRCLHSGRRAPAARRRHVRQNTVLCAHIGVRPPGPAVRIYAHSHPGTIYPGLMVAF